MLLSDTTNKNGALQEIEKWCGFKDGHITGNSALKKRFIGEVNQIRHLLGNYVMEAQDGADWDDPNHTDFPIVTTPLTTNRDYRLTASEKIQKIKRMDVTYDGTNYYRAEPIDSSQIEIGLGNEAEVDKHFSITNPKYDVKYGSWFLYPRATQAQVDAGAEALIEWTRDGTELANDDSDDAVDLGFDAPFDKLVPMMVSYEWIAINKPNNSVTLGTLKREIGDVDKRTGMIGSLMNHYGNKLQDKIGAFQSGEYLTNYR